MGDLCTKAGERETRKKSVSLPPKAGELASLQSACENSLSCCKKYVSGNEFVNNLNPGRGGGGAIVMKKNND